MGVNILVVAGARPNFMKVAPILEALDAEPSCRVRLVHTGQHYDHAMSETFFADLGIRQPDMNLGVGSGSHAEQTAKVMVAFERVCLEDRPDWVVVVGDVNSTFACAVTARKLGIQVAHVEAGLRSRDMTMPEEINRLCTDAVADLLFTTEAGANANLRSEGVGPERIAFVGNTMIDSLLRCLDRACASPLPEGVGREPYGVVTLHRPSNVDRREALAPLFGALVEIARELPLMFPIHPRTRRNLDTFGLLDEGGTRIKFIEPQSYLPFIGLVSRAVLVLTDSGGIQEETTVLGVPCLTLRENTERPVTCEVGTNVLVGTDPARIVSEARTVLAGKARRGRVPPLWDGRAGARIAHVLLRQGVAAGSTAENARGVEPADAVPVAGTGPVGAPNKRSRRPSSGFTNAPAFYPGVQLNT